MKVESLIVLGQLKEAVRDSKPNRENRCIGLINKVIAIETEEADHNPEEDLPRKEL